MFPYADYEFYTEKTQGTLDKITFDKEVAEASIFIRYITLGKSDSSDLEELKYVACLIAEMYAKEKSRYESGASAVKSENTDGYTVTYATEMKDGESLDDLLSKKAMVIARKYLATTGLLNRRVRRIC